MHNLYGTQQYSIIPLWKQIPLTLIPLWHFLFYEVLYHCSVKWTLSTAKSGVTQGNVQDIIYYI